MVKKFERDAPRPFDRLIVEVLPEIPELYDWPDAFLQQLEAAHSKLSDKEEQRDGLVKLAYLYHANGFVRQAESCYLGLESYETQNALWPYLLGVLKADRRDKAVVATHFAQSINLDPTNPLAYLRIGDAYRQGGLLDEARTAYEYCLLGSPNNPWALASLGLLAQGQGNWSLARDWLEKAREELPELAIVNDALPAVYIELEDYESAKQVREEAQGLSLVEEPDDPALAFLEDDCYNAERLLRFAQTARARGDLKRALDLLQRAVELDAENAEVALELSRLIEEVESRSGE